jgi:predicted nucleic acid-binding protein
VIYLDSSVVLAELLMEDRRPPTALWEETLVSSRLLEYEVWNRLHARGLGVARGDGIRLVLSQITLYELSPDHLARALHSFPITVRTLDALHLATAEFLRRRGRTVTLGSYDERLLAAAAALGIEPAPL